MVRKTALSVMLYLSLSLLLLVPDLVQSRWCSHEEFINKETQQIRLELVPGYCKWLGLGGLELTAENLRNFSITLAMHSELVHLGLGSNNIGDEGAVELAKGLANDDTLQWLSLHSNNIGDVGAIALAEALSNHPKLTILSLWENDIGDDGVIAIAESLKTNRALRELSLAMNPRITDVGLRALSAAFKDISSLGQRQELQTFWLHGLPLLSDQGREDFGATLVGDSDQMTFMDNYAPDDGHPLCRRWAYEGECIKNSIYMRKVCASTCGDYAATRFIRRFTDGHPECPAWAMQEHGCAPIATTCALSCQRVAKGINTHPHGYGHDEEL